jgi:cellulase (glycosyl hydrolase family 5)
MTSALRSRRKRTNIGRQWYVPVGLVVSNFVTWGLLIAYSPFALKPQQFSNAESQDAVRNVQVSLVAAPASPTSGSSPIPTPTQTAKSFRSLPALYVDGPYVRRGDNHQPIWLKGVNIEEFRQSNPHTLADLYSVQGLRIVVGQRWGINLLRVAIDPETAESTQTEIAKLVDYAAENGIYVILTPFASAVNPSRNEAHLPIPDDLAALTMGNLAAAFRDRTNVLYEVWNEPHPDSIPSISYDQQWQAWTGAAIKVATAIRNHNPQAILVVPGGNKWARDLTYYKNHPFPFGGVVYDAHDYWAYPAYHYDRDMWTWAIGKYPVLIGEFGGDPTNPSDHTAINYMQDTIRIVNRNPDMVHYTMYALSNDGVWGIFSRTLSNMPKGNLLWQDLDTYPPTRFH